MSIMAPKTEEDCPIIKIYEIGEKKFAMTDDLNRFVQMPGLNEMFLWTVDELEAKRILDSRVDQTTSFKFVYIPLERSELIPDPYGGLCKLAVDHFFDLLHYFIVDVKLFQRTQSWYKVVKFFNRETHFDAEKTEMYFIRSSTIDYADQYRRNYFDNYLDKPEKEDMRGDDNGFTRKRLDLELIHLELTEQFPEITDYAGVVHDHVSIQKKGRPLGIADLREAVEHCQMICFFKRFPELTKFLHNQHSCHRVLITDCCDHREKAPKPLKEPERRMRTHRFAMSEWKSIPLKHVKLTRLPGNERKGMMDKKMNIGNGVELVYNDYLVNTIPKRSNSSEMYQENFPNDKVFLMDKKETVKTDFTTLNAMKSLEEMAKREKRKMIYLRTFFWSPIARETGRQVFADEVKEIIPILLEQQGDPVDIQKLDAYWIENFDRTPPTPQLIFLKDLANVLSDFDIDKSQITLVPDIAFASAVLYQMPFSTGCPMIVINGPNRQRLVHKHQAIFKIFQEVVCDVPWGIGQRAKYSLRIGVLRKMMECVARPYQSLVPEAWVEESVKQLKECDYYLYMRDTAMSTNKYPLLIKLSNCRFADIISFNSLIFEFICGLRIRIGCWDQAHTIDIKEATISGWKARLIFLFEMIELFLEYEPRYGELKKIIINGILFRAPRVEWNSQEDFLDLLLNGVIDTEMVNRANEFANDVSYKPVNQHEWLPESAPDDGFYLNRQSSWMGTLWKVFEFASYETQEERVAKKSMQLLRSILLSTPDPASRKGEERISEVGTMMVEMEYRRRKGKITEKSVELKCIEERAKEEEPQPLDEPQNPLNPQEPQHTGQLRNIDEPQNPQNLQEPQHTEHGEGIKRRLEIRNVREAPKFRKLEPQHTEQPRNTDEPQEPQKPTSSKNTKQSEEPEDEVTRFRGRMEEPQHTEQPRNTDESQNPQNPQESQKPTSSKNTKQSEESEEEVTRFRGRMEEPQHTEQPRNTDEPQDPRELTNAEWRVFLSDQEYRQNFLETLIDYSGVKIEGGKCVQCNPMTLEQVENLLERVEEAESLPQFMAELENTKKMVESLEDVRRKETKNKKKQKESKDEMTELRSRVEELETKLASAAESQDMKMKKKQKEHNDEMTKSRRKVEELEKKLAAAEKELSQRRRKEEEQEKRRKRESLVVIKKAETKESSNCGKCLRTSEMCEEAKKEAKGFKNKVEKLEKKLTAAEKELKEEKEKAEERRVEEEERFGRMEMEVKEAKNAGEAVEESIKQLNLEKKEQSTIIGEKDRIIRMLKQVVPGDALAGLAIERTTEMRKIFYDLQMKLNEMRTLDPLGTAQRQVSQLKKLTQDAATQQFAEVERLQIRVKYEKYSSAIDRNIAMMQEDPLTTREELLPVPEFPSLTEAFYEKLNAAMEANNEKIDKECTVCYDPLALRAWDRCSKCTQKFHADCAKRWWRASGHRTCPYCRK